MSHTTATPIGLPERDTDLSSADEAGTFPSNHQSKWTALGLPLRVGCLTKDAGGFARLDGGASNGGEMRADGVAEGCQAHAVMCTPEQGAAE